MGWRKKMGLVQDKKHLNIYPQKEQKPENNHSKEAFATIATIALKNQNEKTCWNCSLLSLENFPGLCKWYPERKLIPVSIIEKGCKQFKLDLSPLDKQTTRLWNHAHKMADFTDSNQAPFEERKALVQAIFNIGQTIDKLKEK